MYCCEECTTSHASCAFPGMLPLLTGGTALRVFKKLAQTYGSSVAIPHSGKLICLRPLVGKAVRG